MNVNEAFPSNYLKSADLGGRVVRVQIDKVQPEEVGRDKERKLVIYFVSKTKGMILNKTNATTLMNAYGHESDNWHGADVELYTAMVEFGGKQTEGLRMRIPPRQPAATPPPRPQRSDFPPDRPAAAGAAEQPRGSHHANLGDDVPFAPFND